MELHISNCCWIKIPQDLAKELFDEFWKQFAGVRKWQRWLGNRYNELGYAEPYLVAASRPINTQCCN